MSRPLGNRPSPALIIAFIALLVALGGNAVADTGTTKAAAKRPSRPKHSDAKLDSKLVKSLASTLSVKFAATAGNAGHATTADTASTATSAVHAASASSAPLPATLPSGESLSGAYGLIGNAAVAGARAGSAISFDIPLASAPTAHFIRNGAIPPPQCPGSAAAPAAAPGNLCIYESVVTNVAFQSYENPVTEVTGGAVPAFGAEVVAASVGAGNYDDSGSWAVTAP